MKNSNKCIVTGGAGFIGSNLCDRLLEQRFEVYCIDNFLTGNQKNISHLSKNPSFHFIKHDIISPLSQEVQKELDGTKCIYHLASPASPPQYRRYSIETLRVNSEGTFNILQIARQNGSKFLLASTSEVYGNPHVHPQKETYYGNVNTVGTRSCYDEAKRFAESLTMEFFRKFQLSIRIVRIFNTYGPRMQPDDGRVVSNFINQALSDKPLTIYGDGSQTRSFCYVSDMVEGLLIAGQKEGLDGEVINMGNPDEKTIKEIGEYILKLTGSKSHLMNVKDKEIDDPDRRKPDITKAKRLLQWQPQIPLSEGLIRTVDYFKKV
ncbi:SDR family oxidoreductase [Patescibacteria group bacterium]|nr:SDR family oxidoreductase [Patescibacteria group bacterium]